MWLTGLCIMSGARRVWFLIAEIMALVEILSCDSWGLGDGWLTTTPRYSVRTNCDVGGERSCLSRPHDGIVTNYAQPEHWMQFISDDQLLMFLDTAIHWESVRHKTLLNPSRESCIQLHSSTTQVRGPLGTGKGCASREPEGLKMVLHVLELPAKSLWLKQTALVNREEQQQQSVQVDCLMRVYDAYCAVNLMMKCSG